MRSGRGPLLFAAAACALEGARERVFATGRESEGICIFLGGLCTCHFSRRGAARRATPGKGGQNGLNSAGDGKLARLAGIWPHNVRRR